MPLVVTAQSHHFAAARNRRRELGLDHGIAGQANAELLRLAPTNACFAPGIARGALASAESVALLADFLGLPPPTRLQLSPELQRRKTIDLLAQRNLAMAKAQLAILEALACGDARCVEIAETRAIACMHRPRKAALVLDRVLVDRGDEDVRRRLVEGALRLTGNV